jgi:hypothetical protein
MLEKELEVSIRITAASLPVWYIWIPASENTLLTSFFFLILRNATFSFQKFLYSCIGVDNQIEIVFCLHNRYSLNGRRMCMESCRLSHFCPELDPELWTGVTPPSGEQFSNPVTWEYRFPKLRRFSKAPSGKCCTPYFEHNGPTFPARHKYSLIYSNASPLKGLTFFPLYSCPLSLLTKT